VFWDHQLPATLFLISALRKPESLWDGKQHTDVNVTHDSIAWERRICERSAMLWKIGLQDVLAATSSQASHRNMCKSCHSVRLSFSVKETKKKTKKKKTKKTFQTTFEKFF
jgi:hypothetical protein